MGWVIDIDSRWAYNLTTLSLNFREQLNAYIFFYNALSCLLNWLIQGTNPSVHKSLHFKGRIKSCVDWSNISIHTHPSMSALNILMSTFIYNQLSTVHTKINSLDSHGCSYQNILNIISGQLAKNWSCDEYVSTTFKLKIKIKTVTKFF